MKRFTLKLTEKQIESITAALFEWGQQEGMTGSPEGRANAKHMDATSGSIYRQVEKEKAKKAGRK